MEMEPEMEKQKQKEEEAMSDDAARRYDPRYLAGIEYFNTCDFFEAHEVWEELWQEDTSESRRFYQGLIQMAVCLHHFGNGNIRGARKLYDSSRAYLERYRPIHEGLDLDKLLGDFERCCRDILVTTEEFPRIEMDPERIPEIHLITE